MLILDRNEAYTCETLDVGEQDADIFIAMNVYPVKLIRRERYRSSASCLPRDIANHLLGDKIR